MSSPHSRDSKRKTPIEKGKRSSRCSIFPPGALSVSIIRAWRSSRLFGLSSGRHGSKSKRRRSSRIDRSARAMARACAIRGSDPSLLLSTPGRHILVESLLLRVGILVGWRGSRRAGGQANRSRSPHIARIMIVATNPAAIAPVTITRSASCLRIPCERRTTRRPAARWLSTKKTPSA